jgi:mRNA interferase MazF
MYKRGSIVLVPFPFTDLSGSKVRPALIISKRNIGSDVTVLFLSSRTEKVHRYDVLVRPSPKNGLKVTSLVKCTKLATLDTKTVLGELGVLEKQIHNRVDRALLEYLGL